QPQRARRLPPLAQQSPVGTGTVEPRASTREHLTIAWRRSDTLPRHVLHDCFARPEAQLTARRNELSTALRSVQRDAPVVAAVRHATLSEERQRGLDIADE